MYINRLSLKRRAGVLLRLQIPFSVRRQSSHLRMSSYKRWQSASVSQDGDSFYCGSANFLALNHHTTYPENTIADIIHRHQPSQVQVHIVKSAGRSSPHAVPSLSHYVCIGPGDQAYAWHLFQHHSSAGKTLWVMHEGGRQRRR